MALGAASRPDVDVPPRTQDLDPAGFLDALQRGEVNGESLVVIIGIAIVAGLLLTLLVAAIRGRRRRRLLDVPAAAVPAAPARAAPPMPGATLRSEEPWPLDDPVLRRAAMFAGPDAFADRPPAAFTAVPRAPTADPWPGVRPPTATETAAESALRGWPDSPAPHEAGIAGDPGTDEPFPKAEEPLGAPEPVPARAMGLAATSAAMASSGLVARAPEWQMRVAPSVDAAPASVPIDAPSSLGSPQAPLVVKLLGDGRGVGSGPRSGPNLSVVIAIAIATFAVGLSFAAGALVGAALGTTLGATIGIAFAGGAGTAIGVTAIFLRGLRR